MSAPDVPANAAFFREEGWRRISARADVGRIFRVAEALEFGMVGINEGLISTEIAPFVIPSYLGGS